MEKDENNLVTDNELIYFDDSWCKHALSECKKLLKKESKEKQIDPKDIEISITGLKYLVSVLYRASLKTEEGRFPGIGVAWISDENLLKEFFWTKFRQEKQINILEKPELPTRNFHKLASLCVSEAILLLVKGDDTKLYAWGMVDLRNPESESDKLPEDSLSDKHLKALTIHFNHPGIFEIRYKGKYIKNYPATELSPQALGGPESQLKFFNLDKKSRNQNNIYYFNYARIFITEHALGCLVSRKSGGVLLFSPSEQLESTGNQVEIKTKINEQVKNIVAKNSDNQFHMTEDARYRLMNVADWIATFAAIDGSTALNWDLDVIQYGIKTEEKTDDYNCCIEKEARDWLKERGTRHNSAAAWVAACNAFDENNQRKRRFSLVVSADGDVNAFYWRGDKVHRTPVIYRRLA